jgi:hypothetical protein
MITKITTNRIAKVSYPRVTEAALHLLHSQQLLCPKCSEADEHYTDDNGKDNGKGNGKGNGKSNRNADSRKRATRKIINKGPCKKYGYLQFRCSTTTTTNTTKAPTHTFTLIALLPQIYSHAKAAKNNALLKELRQTGRRFSTTANGKVTVTKVSKQQLLKEEPSDDESLPVRALSPSSSAASHQNSPSIDAKLNVLFDRFHGLFTSFQEANESGKAESASFKREIGQLSDGLALLTIRMEKCEKQHQQSTAVTQSRRKGPKTYASAAAQTPRSTANIPFPVSVVKNRATAEQAFVAASTSLPTVTRQFQIVALAFSAMPCKQFRRKMVDAGIPGYVVADCSFIGKSLLLLAMDSDFVLPFRQFMQELGVPLLQPNFDVTCKEAMRLIGHPKHIAIAKIANRYMHMHSRVAACKSVAKRQALKTLSAGIILRVFDKAAKETRARIIGFCENLAKQGTRQSADLPLLHLANCHHQHGHLLSNNDEAVMEEARAKSKSKPKSKGNDTVPAVQQSSPPKRPSKKDRPKSDHPPVSQSVKG